MKNHKAASMLPPINFHRWIDENRELLRPPVGNKVIYPSSEYIIMVVGGPNQRTDFHVNSGEEFFYQVEGDIHLELIVEGELQKVPIKEGEIFLLPGGIPHSPQRGKDTVGLVIEHTRRPEQEDGFQWYCPHCQYLLYQEFFHVSDIVTQLPPVFERFKKSREGQSCSQCGAL